MPWRRGLPDVAETSLPALAAGYSPKQAAHDLVAGAFRSRQPPRRREDVPLGWWWQALLVVLAGFVAGIDVYLREPFKASDLPPDMAGWLPFFNFVGNPAISILVALLCWLFGMAGGRLISFGRFSLREVGSGLAFGWWSATLPILGAIVLGMALGLKSDTIATIVIFLVTLHLVPSVAESCGISISHSFAVIALGPLVLLLLVGLGLLAFGFSGKLMGFGLIR